MNFNAYLRAVTEQVRKHGAGKLTVAADRKALRFGFTSPDGEFMIRVAEVKAAYVIYIVSGERVPNAETMQNEIGSFYQEKFEKAVREGARLRKLDEMN